MTVSPSFSLLGVLFLAIVRQQQLGNDVRLQWVTALQQSPRIGSDGTGIDTESGKESSVSQDTPQASDVDIGFPIFSSSSPTSSSSSKEESPPREKAQKGISHANSGRYNNCHEKGNGVFWIYIVGYLEGFGLHPANLRSFVKTSHSCVYVVIVTDGEKIIQEENLSGGKEDGGENNDGSYDFVQGKLNTVKALRAQGWSSLRFVRGTAGEIRAAGGGASLLASDTAQAINVGYVLIRGGKNWDSFEKKMQIVVSAGSEIARVHKIPTDKKDVIAVMKPSTIIGRGIDYAKVQDKMNKAQDLFLLLPQGGWFSVGGDSDAPEGNAPKGNESILDNFDRIPDPSDAFVLGPRIFWESVFVFKNGTMRASASQVSSEKGKTKCHMNNLPSSLSSPSSPGVFFAGSPFFDHARGMDIRIPVYFIEQPILFNEHLVNDDVRRGLPMSTVEKIPNLPTPNSPVYSEGEGVDVTRNVRCVVGICSPSRGEEVKGAEGLSVCEEVGDV